MKYTYVQGYVVCYFIVLLCFFYEPLYMHLMHVPIFYRVTWLPGFFI